MSGVEECWQAIPQHQWDRCPHYEHTALMQELFSERSSGRGLRPPPSPYLDWLFWGESMSKNRSHHWPIVHSLGVCEWSVVVMMQSGDNSWLVYQSSLEVLPAETSGASRRNGRRSENFAYQYMKYLKGCLTRHKILRHGTSGFTSHPKEGVPRIFIALKDPSLRPGLNREPWVQWQAH
jgi:hypothetical protein